MLSPSLVRRQFLLSATVACSLTPLPRSARAAARPTPIIPRRLLFADAERSWVRISPDGRRIAFLAPVNGVLNLWVAPIGDVGKARPVTRVTDRSIDSNVVWLPD